jgi:hypothetical protein
MMVVQITFEYKRRWRKNSIPRFAKKSKDRV